MTDREQGFQLPLTATIDRRHRQINIGDKPPKKGEDLRRRQELDQWYSEEMYFFIRQDVQTWFNNLGAKTATSTSMNVEDVGIEMFASDSLEELGEKLRSARGHYFSAQDILDKARADINLLEQTSGIQKGWAVNYLEERFIPSLSEAWELNSRYQNQLKASVRQGRFPKF